MVRLRVLTRCSRQQQLEMPCLCAPAGLVRRGGCPVGL